MFSKSKPSPEIVPTIPQNPQNSQRNNNRMSNSSHTFSIIASDVEIVGNLNARVDLHIDGKVQGDVTCGSIVQGEGSVIAGKVTAESAKLSGKVEGSIEANDLVIEASARIHRRRRLQQSYHRPRRPGRGQIQTQVVRRGFRASPSTTVDIGKGADPLIMGAEAKVA